MVKSNLNFFPETVCVCLPAAGCGLAGLGLVGGLE